MARLRVFFFNFKTLGKYIIIILKLLVYFKNSENNLVSFWYMGDMNESHEIPCSAFK